MGGRAHHAENIPRDWDMRAEFTDLGGRLNEAVNNHAPNQQRGAYGFSYMVYMWGQKLSSFFFSWKTAFLLACRYLCLPGSIVSDNFNLLSSSICF